MSVFDGVNPFGEPLKRAWLTDLEDGTNFWNRTDQLRQIAWSAAKQRVSAWGVLAVVMEHQASHIDPTHVLVRNDGTCGADLVEGTSLSGYVSLVAASGGGKNTVFRTASALVPPATSPIPTGTGQGILKSFAETVKIVEKDGDEKNASYGTKFQRHVVVIHADEIDQLNAEFKREGSSTDSMMRSMWTGATAGTTTGDVTRRVNLPPNLYRLHGVWGVQPTCAGSIMSRADGGTPQRFVWAPAAENRVRADAPRRTAPTSSVLFKLPVFNAGCNPFGVSGGQLPEVYRDGDQLPAPTWVTYGSSPKLQQWYAAALSERDDMLDHEQFDIPTDDERAARDAYAMRAHSTLTILKQTVKMAWLHGRCEPSDLDLELTLIQMKVSDAVAAGVWHLLSHAEYEELRKKGVDRGRELHVADIARDDAVVDETSLLAEDMWRKLAETGPSPVRSLRDGLSSRRRKLAVTARQHLEDQGRIRTDHMGYLWAFTVDGNPVTHQKTTFVPKT